MDIGNSVYLDSNVIIEMSDGRLNGLKSHILNSVKSEGTSYPFSAALVSEITRSPLTDQCLDRLNFLSLISDDLYFVHSIYDYEFRKESPASVWETITGGALKLDEKSLLTGSIPFESLKQVRSQLGLEPQVLNNLSGKKAVATIDAALSMAMPENSTAPRSMKDLLVFLKAQNRAINAQQWTDMGTSEAHMTIGDDLHIMFSLLDSFGYWPDTEKVYRKGSRYPDTQHVFNASQCDVLVTRDRGMRNRAEAVYSILEIDTTVMSTDEYVAYVGCSQ